MKTYTGINIQYPISRLILEGKKEVETRTYCIPKKFLNKELLIIETPGKMGKFKSRIVGTIVFHNAFRYSSKEEFYLDKHRHFVDENSTWAWKGKAKWGWEISEVKHFRKPIDLNKRTGIVFTKDLKL